MSQKSNFGTAIIRGEYLYTDDDHNGTRIGTPEWETWLEMGLTFYFDSERHGTFTARAEQRRNRYFWYAFKKVDGKLKKRYMGRSSGLTLGKLIEVAKSF